MLSVYHWNPTHKRGDWHTEAPSTLVPTGGIPEGEVWWIDLVDPTPEEENQIFRWLPIHPLTVEDITRPRRTDDPGHHLPKVEEFSDYLFVIVNPVRLSASDSSTESSAQPPEVSTGQMSAVLTHSVLITHHYQHLPCVEVVKQFLARHADQAQRGPDYIFHLIVDEMVDEYAPIVDQVIDGLDTIETNLLENPAPQFLHQLLKWKRQVIALRKTLIHEREVLSRLIRGEFELVDVREIAYYRNVYDHLVRYSELIENAREMTTDLMQTHLASMSNRLNSVMKMLAMISTVVLPMTLVAGIYGMNFHHGMPELDWEWGYPFALGLMAVFAMISVGVFYWKRWL